MENLLLGDMGTRRPEGSKRLVPQPDTNVRLPPPAFQDTLSPSKPPQGACAGRTTAQTHHRETGDGELSPIRVPLSHSPYCPGRELPQHPRTSTTNCGESNFHILANPIKGEKEISALSAGSEKARTQSQPSCGSNRLRHTDQSQKGCQAFLTTPQIYMF